MILKQGDAGKTPPHYLRNRIWLRSYDILTNDLLGFSGSTLGISTDKSPSLNEALISSELVQIFSLSKI